MYLVVGATGQSGRAVVEALRERGAPVRVLLRPGRDTEPFRRLGCDVAVADLTRAETLPAAVAGVEGIALFVGVGHDLHTRPSAIRAVEIDGSRALLEAVVASGAAPHVVYLSALAAEHAPWARPFTAKLETERSIRELGLPFTILRPSNFTESITGDFVQDGVANLAGRFPHETSPLSVHDLGAIAARALAELGPSGAVHELFGPETLTYRQVIETWAAARGETVRVRTMPLAAFRAVATVASPVRPLLPVIAELIRSFNELDWSGDPDEARKLAGRDLLTVVQAAVRSPSRAIRP
jgi:NAD(P)H dehydrogenase (quinone)